MEKGIYKRNKTDFESYAVSKFVPHLFDHSAYGLYGCGATALSLITGIKSNIIFRSKKFKENESLFSWNDTFMRGFLRKQGFSIIPITLCEVSNFQTYIESPIKNYHVILMSQLMKKNEASWSVIFNNYIFHNFEILPLKPLEFINNPILSAYVIYKDEWK